MIRVNNCIYCTSIVLSCLTICIDCEALDCAAHCARTTSNVLFMCTMGCMMGQTHREIKFREGRSAPTGDAMER